MTDDLDLFDAEEAEEDAAALESLGLPVTPVAPMNRVDTLTAQIALLDKLRPVRPEPADADPWASIPTKR
jgi:hypothetical protein